MKNVLVNSLEQIPYDIWVFPGILLLIAAITANAVIYRDLFDLRVHQRAFLPLTLAPFSKTQLILGFLVISAIEATFYVLVAMGVLNFFLPKTLSALDYFMILVFTPIFIFILGNILITFSLLIDRITTYLSTILVLFLIILFGSGVLVELEFYPKTISLILSNLPLSMILYSLRDIIFSNRVDWTQIFIPIFVAIIWTWFNGFLLKRKLNQ
ncbi:MAG: hypothetical protein ISR82_08280 [Candidatus Marinimicrobia bacterium]|nr:hypothetical protein [Candidatus Neomarinimicrobiota bacterium]MBL7031364.1 hypothetical protein [Candidatus Neomarinimicrobiota bacterium]